MNKNNINNNNEYNRQKSIVCSVYSESEFQSQDESEKYVDAENSSGIDEGQDESGDRKQLHADPAETIQMMTVEEQTPVTVSTSKNIRKDLLNIIFLIYLYLLQGVPLGQLFHLFY
jgi:hypothetical protein